MEHELEPQRHLLSGVTARRDGQLMPEPTQMNLRCIISGHSPVNINEIKHRGHYVSVIASSTKCSVCDETIRQEKYSMKINDVGQKIIQNLQTIVNEIEKGTSS